MSATGEPLVSLRDIRKTFGATVAIDTLSLDISSGEFVTFLGPSGCGKSTTLRVLAGFETPDRGQVILNGQDVTHTPPNKRNVNMVFQDYGLFPHMTVGRNIGFGLELKGLSKPAIEARRRELAEFLEISALLDRRPSELSGGQRQRVALARALAPEPDLLLLDEPLASLDAKLRAQVQIELKDIQRRTGKTFFFVTHDQDEAMTMSDRIVVMRDGRVEQDGTPEDLYLRPRTRFVAEFIGETNLLHCELSSDGNGGVSLDWNGVSVALDGPARRVNGRQPVSAVVRPEQISISPDRPDRATCIRVKVVGRLFKGSRTVFDVRPVAADGNSLKVYSDGQENLSPGDDAWIGWSAGSVSILDE